MFQSSTKERNHRDKKDMMKCVVNTCKLKLKMMGALRRQVIERKELSKATKLRLANAIYDCANPTVWE